MVDKINDIIRYTESNFAKNVSEIDNLVKNAKNEFDHYDGSLDNFIREKFHDNNGEGIHVEKKMRSDWEEVERNFRNRFNLAFDEIDQKSKKEKWYSTLLKLKDVYTQSPDIRGTLIMNTYTMQIT